MERTATLPDRLETTRLCVATATPASLRSLAAKGRAVLDGTELTNPGGLLTDDEAFLAELFAARAEVPANVGWTMRLILLGSTIIGHCGFHLAPSDRAVEIGYSLAPEWRGQGFATEAVEALLLAASTSGVVDVVDACIAPDNEPSLALAKRLGFVFIDEVIDDEDGIELRHRKQLR